MALSHLFKALGSIRHQNKKAKSVSFNQRKRLNRAARPVVEAVEQRMMMSTTIWNTSYDFEGTTPNTSGWSTSTVHTSTYPVRKCRS